MNIQLRRCDPTGRARSGFSLIECSIAMVMMVLGVFAAFYSQVSSANLLRSVREHNAAVNDMEGCMEQIMLLSIDAMTSPTGPYAPGVPVAAYNDLHLTGERLVPTYPNMVGATVPDPLEIRVTATWSDWRGRPQTLFITTMKTR